MHMSCATYVLCYPAAYVPFTGGIFTMMNRVTTAGKPDFLIINIQELNDPTDQAVAVAELAKGNCLSVLGISIHTEGSEVILVVDGQDYRTKRSTKEVISLLVRHKTNILAALAITANVLKAVEPTEEEPNLQAATEPAAPSEDQAIYEARMKAEAEINKLEVEPEEKA